MDRKSSRIDFAIIGHQDSWSKAVAFANRLRPGNRTLSEENVRDVYTFIPPRDIFNIDVYSAQGEPKRGVYIETFIAPDELDVAHLRTNFRKVKDACEFASSKGIPIVSLGGFTSIILENSCAPLLQIDQTFFTTGNTLTAAFITKGVEKACKFRNKELSKCSVLIIGATGDIGSACTRYFSKRVAQLLLCARSKNQLERMSQELLTETTAKWSLNANDLLPLADVVICVASSILEQSDFNLLSPDAVICDAGYPKNIQHFSKNNQLFWGGMGWVQYGYKFSPDYKDELYSFPSDHISHGCVLESIVLAMENRHEAFSQGRGNISVAAMTESLEMAARHGIYTAPLFNSTFSWEEIKNEPSFTRTSSTV